jgi:hypothetical protein
MTMTGRSEELAERLRAFNNEVIAFVEKCTDEDWRKMCAWEEWTVGVTARHIGAGHYGVVGLAKMIVNGDKLPELTRDQLIQMANQHAREHAACTKAEVLDILRKNGESLVAYVAGLDDAALDRTGYLAAVGGELNTQQFLENVIVLSGGEHFANMKTAASA